MLLKVGLNTNNCNPKKELWVELFTYYVIALFILLVFAKF